MAVSDDTLTQLVTKLRQMGATTITIGERSGPPDTKDVLKDKNLYLTSPLPNFATGGFYVLHMVRVRRLGIPQESREVFDMW